MVLSVLHASKIFAKAFVLQRRKLALCTKSNLNSANVSLPFATKNFAFDAF